MLKGFFATSALAFVAFTAIPAMADNAAPYYTTAAAGNDHLVTKLLGQNVYDSDASNADTIGEINDIVVDSRGQIQAVIIGVGGFLGMGEKNVAVNYSSLKWMRQPNGNAMVAVLPTTKENLKNAPAFDTAALEPSASININNANNTNNTTGSAATMTSSTDSQANLTPVKASAISASKLKDSTVYSADNKDIGKVNDVLLGKDGKISAVVLDVGGFLGMGAKPVAIAFDSLELMTDQNSNLYVHTKFTKAQLEQAPTYDKDAYTRNPHAITLSSKS
jgi:sporulation protein YlmC with PRC-barrel domain